MLEKTETKYISIVRMTKLVSAYVSHNPVSTSELSSLIQRVYEVFNRTLDAATDTPKRDDDKPKLARIRQSVTSDALISFIDGKPYKTLKRHLNSHGLNPDVYRDRYGLPADYPMVAPGYAKRRSQIAKATGLGGAGSRSNQRRALMHR